VLAILNFSFKFLIDSSFIWIKMNHSPKKPNRRLPSATDLAFDLCTSLQVSSTGAARKHLEGADEREMQRVAAGGNGIEASVL
jgi:hypothetical protein